MKKWLFHPFVYVAGARALVAGCAAMAVTAIISYFSHTHFDGVIDVHARYAPSPLWVYFTEPVIDWGCAAVLFYITGRVFSRSSIRFIDMAGTQALARWPMVFAAVFDFGIKIPPDIHKLAVNDIINAITGSMILIAFLIVGAVIWMVGLMYQAFSVSCNLKGGRAIGLFIGGIAVAEIASKILFHFLNHL